MKSRVIVRKPVVLALSVAFGMAPAWAQESVEPVVVDVSTTRLNPDAVLEGRRLDLQRAANPDAASLLTGVAGYAVRGAGAISGLPVIRGLADDRLTIKVDGVNAMASCPNHMNSPLSYVDPTSVQEIKVYKSITPASVGGNSIGGAIVVNTSEPWFSEEGRVTFDGQIGGFYYSNGDGTGGNISATAANDKISVNYTGSTASANNYSAARNFNSFAYGGPIGKNMAGQPSAQSPSNPVNNSTVASTGFMTTNQAASMAVKLLDNHTVQFQYSEQNTPFEGFPNQYMDMTSNQQQRLNMRYWGSYDWGRLEAQAYNETVNHQMNFGANRSYWYNSNSSMMGAAKFNIAGMPMNTNATTTGGKVKGTVDLSEGSLLRTGVEYQHYYLNDRWPPVANSTMMGPNTFYNINGGVQQTAAAYGEWETWFGAQLKTSLGVRYEWVNSSTGQVQPYGASSAPENNAANALNSASRNNSNNNVNVTALGQYMVDTHQDAEIGLARQVRNPSLYELYSWSTSSMNAAMNNVVGDGNGYYGNPNLKPETAYTLSGKYDVHSADKSYQASLAPYYAYVYNYIGAVQRYSGVCTMSGCPAVTTSLYQSQYNILQYVNQNAQMAGADLTGRMPLGKTEYGVFGLKGLLSYTYGRNQDTGYGLYNIMPLNSKVTLTHQTSGWDNALELVAVARKGHIDVQRNEYGTAGYFLTNLKGSYTFKQVRVDAGINNVFNTFYSLPLGGAYVGQGQTMSLNNVPYGTPMPGPGISFYSALTVKF